MNNSFGISEKSYNLLVEFLKTYLQIEEVLIFGSRAKGNYKKGSDIDLVIKGKDCSDKLALDISAYIDDELPTPYMVDIINYSSIDNPELKKNIDFTAKSFYS